MNVVEKNFPIEYLKAIIASNGRNCPAKTNWCMVSRCPFKEYCSLDIKCRLSNAKRILKEREISSIYNIKRPKIKLKQTY
jgi:hypothetical protein